MTGITKRLSSLFAAAVAGVGIGAGVTFSVLNDSTPPAPGAPEETVAAVADAPPVPASFPLWQHIRTHDTVPYALGAAPENDTRRKAGTIVIQLEDTTPVVAELVLQGPPSSVFIRHGDAAAEIINDTADRMSGQDVEPLYIRRTEPVMEWFQTPDHPYTRALFENTDVISLSMGVILAGPQREAFSDGTLIHEGQIASADKFWRDTKAILIQAAGNNAMENEGLERRQSVMMTRADTMLIVGEARRRDDGETVVFRASSRNGVSVVAENPFFNGFSYPFVRDEDSLRDFLGKMYDAPRPGTNRPMKDVFVQSLKRWSIIAANGGRVPLGNPLWAAHPGQDAPDFNLRDTLEQDLGWHVRNPDEARAAFIEGLVASLKNQREMMGADEHGRISELSGTSFSTPHVAGMLAAGRTQFPNLSPRDLTAAALLAAEPVSRAETVPAVKGLAAMFGMRVAPVPTDLTAENNGRNMLFDSQHSGFGLLAEDHYMATLRDMAALLEKNPALATVESHASSGLVTFAKQDVADGQETLSYTIEVTDDIVALRTNLALRFADGPADAPETVTLINPAGGKITFSPSRPGSSDPYNFSLATTDGHFGNYTKGTWTVVVPADSPLAAADLTVEGMQKGGLVDALLKEKVDGAAPTPLPLPKAEEDKTMEGDQQEPPLHMDEEALEEILRQVHGLPPAGEQKQDAPEDKREEKPEDKPREEPQETPQETPARNEDVSGGAAGDDPDGQDEPVEEINVPVPVPEIYVPPVVAPPPPQP